MNSVLSWKDSGKFLHDDGKCTCRKKVLLQHRMFKMSDCLRLSVDIDGIPDALTLTVYAPAFHGKVRVTVTFPSIHLEKESLDTFTKCLVELNEIAGTLDLSNGLPVAGPATEAVDLYLKNTPRPEIRLVGAVRDFLTKKKPRYRVVKVDGKYFAQVRSWGIWWWITHGGRDEVFTRDLRVIESFSCVAFAKGNIEDYKERHKPRPKPVVVEEYE
jgi:hypothetical protein